MTADQFLQYVSWCVYLLIFVVALVRAVRQPTPANADIALFFAAPALIIGMNLAATAGWIAPGPLFGALSGSLLLALAYLLVRLVNDFTPVPPPLLYVAAGGFLLSSAGTFVFTSGQPPWYTWLAVAYFVGLQLYGAVAFLRHAQRSSGVTARRMQAVGIGSLCLGLVIVLAGLQAALPGLVRLWAPLSEIAGLSSAIAYYLGFATPGFLRRAWQEPELRAFLGKAASLPRLPDTAEIVRELERGAALSLGAPYASIGLWDERERVLHFEIDGEPLDWPPMPGTPSGIAFLEQRPAFSADLERHMPQAPLVRTGRARAVLAAPITAGERRLGILSVYAPRAPIFADDDLELVCLLADQAAVILECRALIDEAVRVQAREEATQLKDDFLAAAAHDLKTPLTTLLVQSQSLQRQLRRDPQRPMDARAIDRLVAETQRLKGLVTDLLDAARAEQGQLLGAREPVDLAQAAAAVAARHTSERHLCTVETAAAVVGDYDRMRIIQLLENLVENAVKYSPQGGQVRVQVARVEGEAHLRVSDTGIGIPTADLPHVFDRFYRASNVKDLRHGGSGLGLYICRAIVEQHGGRIWATSEPGAGTTIHVVLPALHARDAQDVQQTALI